MILADLILFYKNQIVTNMDKNDFENYIRDVVKHNYNKEILNYVIDLLMMQLNVYIQKYNSRLYILDNESFLFIQLVYFTHYNVFGYTNTNITGIIAENLHSLLFSAKFLLFYGSTNLPKADIIKIMESEYDFYYGDVPSEMMLKSHTNQTSIPEWFWDNCDMEQTMIDKIHISKYYYVKNNLSQQYESVYNKVQKKIQSIYTELRLMHPDVFVILFYGYLRDENRLIISKHLTPFICKEKKTFLLQPHNFVNIDDIESFEKSKVFNRNSDDNEWNIYLLSELNYLQETIRELQSFIEQQTKKRNTAFAMYFQNVCEYIQKIRDFRLLNKPTDVNDTNQIKLNDFHTECNYLHQHCNQYISAAKTYLQQLTEQYTMTSTNQSKVTTELTNLNKNIFDGKDIEFLKNVGIFQTSIQSLYDKYLKLNDVNKINIEASKGIFYCINTAFIVISCVSYILLLRIGCDRSDTIDFQKYWILNLSSSLKFFSKFKTNNALKNKIEEDYDEEKLKTKDIYNTINYRLVKSIEQISFFRLLFLFLFSNQKADIIHLTTCANAFLKNVKKEHKINDKFTILQNWIKKGVNISDIKTDTDAEIQFYNNLLTLYKEFPSKLQKFTEFQVSKAETIEIITVSTDKTQDLIDRWNLIEAQIDTFNKHIESTTSNIDMEILKLLNLRQTTNVSFINQVLSSTDPINQSMVLKIIHDSIKSNNSDIILKNAIVFFNGGYQKIGEMVMQDFTDLHTTLTSMQNIQYYDQTVQFELEVAKLEAMSKTFLELWKRLNRNCDNNQFKNTMSDFKKNDKVIILVSCFESTNKLLDGENAWCLQNLKPLIENIDEFLNDQKTLKKQNK